jgi:hypothetical protein
MTEEKIVTTEDFTEKKEEKIEITEEVTEKIKEETTTTQSPEDKFVTRAITSGKLLKHLGSIFKSQKFSFVGKIQFL